MYAYIYIYIYIHNILKHVRIHAHTYIHRCTNDICACLSVCVCYSYVCMLREGKARVAEGRKEGRKVHV